MMKRMIFGIATRIDLLDFIMRDDMSHVSGNATTTNGSG